MWVCTYRHEFGVQSKMCLAYFAGVALYFVLVVVVSLVCFPEIGEKLAHRAHHLASRKQASANVLVRVIGAAVLADDGHVDLAVVLLEPALEDDLDALGALHVLPVRVVQLHVALLGHDADQARPHLLAAAAPELARPRVLLDVVVVQVVVLQAHRREDLAAVRAHPLRLVAAQHLSGTIHK